MCPSLSFNFCRLFFHNENISSIGHRNYFTSLWNTVNLLNVTFLSLLKRFIFPKALRFLKITIRWDVLFINHFLLLKFIWGNYLLCWTPLISFPSSRRFLSYFFNFFFFSLMSLLIMDWNKQELLLIIDITWIAFNANRALISNFWMVAIDYLI